MPAGDNAKLRTLVNKALDAARAIARQPDATNELSFRPAVNTLLQGLPDALGMPGLSSRLLTEPKRKAYGTPDYVVKTTKGWIVGYVEAKGVNDDLRDFEDSEQMRRYRDSGQRILLTSLLEFMLFDIDPSDPKRGIARVDHVSLLKKSELLAGHLSPQADVDALRRLLERFLRGAKPDISTPRELAVCLASVARQTADLLLHTLRAEKPHGPLGELKRVFQDTLLPDLTDEAFADMYAQTIAYGLFAAAQHHDPAAGLFNLDTAWRDVPPTNPFLRRLFASVTGIELEGKDYRWIVEDLASLLGVLDMVDILKDFGRHPKTHDPVVHFYEDFLAAYDPKLRELRGVYYTPEPVVSYIVRSVDHLLKTRFALPDGLADTSKVTIEREGKEQLVPRVLVLDPACGTGTFLYWVVGLIRDRLEPNAGNWSNYVRQELLPRLFGFELLMAPYAVAHLKLGMQLAGRDLEEPRRSRLRFDFAGEDRLGVYLTNTLDEAFKTSEQLPGAYGAITEEANHAADVKRDLPIMVVLGNPPYSGHSANRSYRIEREGNQERRVATWIGQLIRDYYKVDGQPLGERNPKWLQDDYVKFLRFGQWRIEQTGAGILAFITNNGYLDNPTFRGMRQQLMHAFTDIYVLDLHGNERKRERAPDGSEDKNVFDIQQGVAVGVFVKEPGRSTPAVVRHAEMWGTREAKYQRLLPNGIETTDWQVVAPSSPFYLFAPQDGDLRAEYEQFPRITEVLCLNVLGFQTHRDHFAIGFDEAAMRARIADLRSIGISDEELRRKYGLADNGDWQLSRARAEVRTDKTWQRNLIQCLYRPFDPRPCYFGTAAMDRPRRELLTHVAGKPNLCVGVGRQGLAVNDPQWSLVACSRDPVDANIFTRGGINVFPLYVYPPGTPSYEQRALGSGATVGNDTGRRPNLDPVVIGELSTRLGLQFVAEGCGDLLATVGPEDILQYVYAVLHSPTYRERYAEFLKIDFPRVPFTGELKLFRALCKKGADLVALHLMEDDYAAASWMANGGSAASPLRHALPTYPIRGSNAVGPVFYLPPGSSTPGQTQPTAEGRVYISRDRPGRPGQYFDGVPQEVWEFYVGGYQVCEKWLKDRKGRTLSLEERTHYPRVVAALRETIRLMQEIDDAIPGWPIT